MKHESSLRVRFCETDMAGHVNNTSYFIYLEEARGKFFREVLPGDVNSVGRFIIASTKCDFVSQAYFGNPLIISSWISHIGRSSFTFTHHILVEGTNERVAQAEAVIVHFNYEKQQSEPLSGELRACLESYLETETAERSV
ncbi:thioesterase family protein [Halobacillus sp. Nhm2S1]|uniref:acyl-CoA thioesterase n=1 Tax=Halobacillus sp. Nhm2S1 TaxID=2866716 RepID=UPI001C73D373|nr:thioesterase family protein [Halobacillus sp. Nhm2S1]MBX0357635.1 acyl-CoA thioesterase [Halobacillus sp. Nhm2S1]